MTVVLAVLIFLVATVNLIAVCYIVRKCGLREDEAGWEARLWFQRRVGVWWVGDGLFWLACVILATWIALSARSSAAMFGFGVMAMAAAPVIRRAWQLWRKDV